jgi:serine/threonine protein kinase
VERTLGVGAVSSSEEVARVIASHKFAKPREVEEARVWGERYHPDQDLAEVLFMRGILDRPKVSLIRKMAKMSRASSSRAPRSESSESSESDESDDSVTPTPVEDPPSRTTTQVTVRELSLSPPERLGKYVIIEKVAQGGMGVIFKARHVELDRLFAVKILAPRTEASKEAVVRFQREAKTAARLDHPNIVRVYDAGVENGIPYLVMDFVDGDNLAEVIKKEGLGVRKAAQIARDIALALHHAHENGVVHRDVKPSNIIIGESGPKITDFGIVKEIGAEDTDDSKLTQTGFTLGSPCYMSPEQAEGRHELVSQRSDVYSLGATLYEMLTEEPPHDGDSIHEIMTKVVRDDPVPVRGRNPAVPKDLDVVCMKALEKEVGRRYTTARELAEDLGRFLSEEPVLATSAGLGTKAWRLVRRNRSSAIPLALFLVLTVASLSAVWSWQHQLRVDAQDAREARIDRAELLLATASAAEDPPSKRRAYYDALQEVEPVLRSDPDHPRAREAKRRIVIELGDHLIETGEASFAEFVFSLGAGLADPAEITSRIETARLGAWIEKAEAAELAGDRLQALEFYRKGLRTLQEAGYSGRQLQARIEDLEDQVREQRHQGDARKIMRLADDSAAEGDHVAAYLGYSRALKLVPDDRDLAGRVAHHRQKAQDEVVFRRRDVLAIRVAVETARKGLTDIPINTNLDALLASGDQALTRAQEARTNTEFAAALSELNVGSRTFGAAKSLATAGRARAQSRREADQAEELRASRFAPTELSVAKEQHYRGDQAFAAGKYDDAARFYNRAASVFRQAALQGDNKSLVADAREQAQRARHSAFNALTKAQRTNRFDMAEADFSRAERHYDKEEYEPARDLYLGCTVAFARVLRHAPQIQEAFGAQARVRSLREDAIRQMAREYASDDFSKGRQAELTADQALASGEPGKASPAYAEALYRYRRALTKARPHSVSRREYDSLFQLVSDARQYCVDEHLEWKPNYKRGEERLRQAEDALQRRYWNGAKRHLERALRFFRSLHK